LDRLGTNYLDAYYIHSPLATPSQRAKVWEEMAKLKNEGLIRACGVVLFSFIFLLIYLLSGKRGEAPKRRLNSRLWGGINSENRGSICTSCGNALGH